jgi:hypothetical protein
VRIRFPIRYGEFLDQWKFQLLETVSRLVCKCVRQFRDRIGRISCQEVRHVRFDDCSVYRNIEQKSICGHGMNIHHKRLPHKDFFTGITHQMFHRQGVPYKIWGPLRKILQHPTQNVHEIFPLSQFCYFTLCKEKFKKELDPD